MNLDEICAQGIHYFRYHETAFYYELDKVYNGEYKSWYNNGQLWEEYTYVNGELV